MVNAFNTSLSGLLAFQRALSTTSHNIANVATDGYSRQRVNLGTMPPQFWGGNHLGAGVRVNSIERVYDQFLGNEVRTGVAGKARLETFHGLAARTSDLLGSDTRGLSAGMQEFFSSVQALANDPSSIPVRQAMLSEAGALTQRITSMDGRLAEMSREVSQRVEASVNRINSLGQGIADLNQRITSAPGAANGNLPADLLDQRDRLLEQLSEQIDVSVDQLDSGAVNVYIGTGQSLVLNLDVNALDVGNGAFGPTDQTVMQGGADIGRQLSGGTLGGLLDFRHQTLDPIRNDLGRTAVALAESFNSVHQQGMDLNGQLGGRFFDVGGPNVLPASHNAGAATVDVRIDDAAGLSGDDYRMEYDGSSWSLRNTATGQNVALSGSGTAADPFVADGLSIEISGAAAAGDRFAIQPTRNAAAGFERLINDPEAIAAASPISTGSGIDNIGSAEISGGEVLDINDPNLLDDVTITFIDANTYQINGSGSFAYSDGDDIDVNGWRVQISGSPAAGDEFTVAANTSGEGDNRNALALGELRQAGVLAGGARSILEHTDSMITEVGAATAAALASLDSQDSLLISSRQALESVRGVNLEEEAANLLKYRQAYEASARVIQTADSMFQSLLSAVR